MVEMLLYIIICYITWWSFPSPRRAAELQAEKRLKSAACDPDRCSVK